MAKQVVEIEQDVLSKNDIQAAKNRAMFETSGVAVLNLVSSPGAGKTSLLVRTLHDLQNRKRFAVLEGDQETDNDAKKIAETGVQVYQINTQSACHLDALMVNNALPAFDLPSIDTLFIENVGNLVCPASYDLGEMMKVAILSVTEGDDKPLKYPKMFRVSKALVITKTDLAPYVDFDIEQAIGNAKKVNPDIIAFELSVKTGDGLEKWYDYLLSLK